MATTSVPFRVIDVGARRQSPAPWTTASPPPRGRRPGNDERVPARAGLCVLSKTHYVLKGLRVAVEEHFRASSKIEISYAASAVSRNCSRDDSHRLDPVSRFLSARFVRLRYANTELVGFSTPHASGNVARVKCASCCVSGTIEWSVSTLRNCHETRSDLPHCSFLKLLIHQPRHHAENTDNQVSIQEIELLGVIQPIDMCQSSLEASDSLDHDACSTESEGLIPRDCGDKELHAALLKAGVALDIVEKVMALASDEAEPVLPEGRRHEQQCLEIAVERESSSPEHQTVATALDSRHWPVVTESLGTCDQYSVFDRALRGKIARKMDEDEIFDQIICRNEDAKPLSKFSALQAFSGMVFRVSLFPKIEAEDRGNLIEIIMYTFGSFFTEYLLCDVSEVRVFCTVIAERFLPILKEAVGVVVVYEGSLALLRVSLQDSDLGVFQACLHLAQTIFQQAPVETSLPQESLSFGSTIGVVTELSESYVKYGLRLVMEAILANPCCWTKEHHHANTSTFRKERINLDFLRFVRLLISQEGIRDSFYQVLLPVEHLSSGNQAVKGGSEQSIHFVETSNRLRLFRLLLQRQKAGHITVPGDILKQIGRFCEALGECDTQTRTAVSSSPSVCRLAADCLHLLHANTVTRLKPFNFRHLNKIHTQIDEMEAAAYKMMAGPAAHEPRFVQFVVPSEQQVLLRDQTRRYFRLRPRPRALYQHLFSHDNLEGQSNHFRKGKIEFRGEMVERNPGDLVAFHELVAQNTQPYTFNLDSKNQTTAQEMLRDQPTIKEISTLFATFKGTVEVRAPVALPIPTIPERIGDRTTVAHQLAQVDSLRQSDSPNASEKLKATAPDPITDTISSDSSNAPDTQTKVRSSNNTRRIASAAPGSPSRHSTAVGDMLPSRSAASAVVPAQPLRAQHPKTAPAGGKQRSAKEADANGGCILQ